jgi:pilus assembly protein Flp/PilA
MIVSTFLTNLFAMIRSEKEDGQTLVEYGLILALISIAAIAIMGTVGGNIVDVFQAVADELHS